METGDTTNVPFGRKDIWTLLKEDKDKNKKKETEVLDAQGSEVTISILGHKSVGKTSLLLKLLDRDENPSSTIGLEYTFGRKTRGVNGIKDIAHIWEIGGGISLLDLLVFPIHESNIHNSAFVIILDLSQPQDILYYLQIIHSRIKERVNTILENLEKKGSRRPKAIRAYAAKRISSDHQDKQILDILPIPLLIIATKWDSFKETEPEKKKLTSKILRYFAHLNGASLMYTSIKDPITVTKCRQLFNYIAFKGTAPSFMATDPDKPIMVSFGNDSLQKLGLSEQTHLNSFSNWCSDFVKYFPSKKGALPTDLTVSNQEEMNTLMSELAKFPEEVIDLLKEKKMSELEAYRKKDRAKQKAGLESNKENKA